MRPQITLKKETLLEHLGELRSRLLKVATIFALTFGGCYAYAPTIYDFLIQPLAHQTLAPEHMIYTNLTEGFLTYVHLAVYGALLLTAPLFFYQLWMFVGPGLYRMEKKVLRPFLIASPLLFYAGAAFVYGVVMPTAWSFFLSFQSANLSLPITLEARISDYLTLTFSFMLAFGLCFQLPVILLILIKVGALSVEQLRTYRKWAILLAFVAAAILTPPDVFSQIGLAIPLILLYEGAIILGALMERKGTRGVKKRKGATHA